ncbi:MAG: N-6 DNA methylase [Phycisphaerales bacterium]|nr:N-6 DNA methylase [Phycisphaerales bacterium]
MIAVSKQKAAGAYYTPDVVVKSLVRWAVRRPSDRMLDPSCGDGRFLAEHANSVGVEQDPAAVAAAHERAPGSLIHEGDFFAWADTTEERFECAAGNPPFIRYQRFAGEVRATAQRLCRRHGVKFSSLASSWAPFIIAAATVLKQGGRMAFVVPAEIGHAPYATPVLEYLLANFEVVHVIAVRKRLFPGLSEDCWLLMASGFGGAATSIRFTAATEFGFSSHPPAPSVVIDIGDWRRWRCRLRPFLLSDEIRELYCSISDASGASRLADIARVGIGYVTGANAFFHLRPSRAKALGIPDSLLLRSVRNGRSLANGTINTQLVRRWIANDQPVLLMHLTPETPIPRPVAAYLQSEEADAARESYKCRSRDPWWSVPDVTVPDAFLSYMSGGSPALVRNEAGCVATNSVHVVRLTGSMTKLALMTAWRRPFTRLSCEIEGHPLGGGLLKLEPREAGRVVLTSGSPGATRVTDLIADGIEQMRRWRHHGEEAGTV